ncbi:MAG: NFACT RNA binding domain-containing protein [Clostridia bacterium]|nr:NFACT RNA binding domain-containing protein [Clostridia bacterium]
MAFDGIVTKAIASELKNLSGARIDKVFEPNKNNIIIGMYLNKINYVLNISIDSGNYRINLTTHPKPNPKIAPNFCMVLRKHLIGLHLKNVITNDLERIVTLEFEGFDDIDDIITKKLVIELMGRHCNVILLDENNIIIDSLRHINNENTNRIIVPHIKYIYPKINKVNLLDCNFEDFCKNVSNENISIPIKMSNSFNGISKDYVTFVMDYLETENLKTIYDYLLDIINRTDSLELKFETNGNNYFLIPSANINTKPFYLNFFIDDFYYERESYQDLKNYKDAVLKLILSTFEKYKKRLKNMDTKLKECENLDKYRLYGELITANLYKISNKNIKEISLENYYDNNKLITIPLDDRYLPSINAKKFYKKYSKLKNTLEIVTIQKQETISELQYLESIIYELECCNSIEEISEILDELSENEMFKEKIDSLRDKKKYEIKKSNLTKNKNISFNPIKYKINGYTLLVGRNNKENDYLTLKYAKKNDLWFHTKDIHGSHAILILDNTTPNHEILSKCAEITAFHSKAKHSSNVPVDYCEVKYVKKPNKAKPGMVIYKNNSTLYVNPNLEQIGTPLNL